MVKNKFYSERINVILGTHNLTDPRVAEQIRNTGKYVILQSEVLREGGIAGWPDNPSFQKIYVPLMQSASAVWHGIESNEKHFAKLGIQADRIPKLGYLPGLEEITHKKRKDIDFLYFGSVTPHRKKLIDALIKLGGNVVCIFDEAAIFRNDYIARTRIHLAPNQGPGINHITAKTLYLLNNRSVVVVERCHEQEWIEHCYLSADPDEWAERCLQTLHRPDLDQLADQFFECYKKLDMTALFQPLLSKLSTTLGGKKKTDSNTEDGEISRLEQLLVNKWGSVPDPKCVNRLESLLRKSATESLQASEDNRIAGSLVGFEKTKVDQLLLFSREVIPGLTSFIILTHDRIEQTKKCVKSIRKHTPEAHEIIFVDNGSTDGTVKWLQSQIRENKNYQLIENRENVGVANGRNQGMNLSQGEFLLLLDNDVVVSEGWLSGMQQCLKHAPDAGIVGPMTNSKSGLQQIADESYRSVDYLDKYAAKFKEQYRHRRISSRNITGFCMLFKRALVEKIGLLDERFDTGRFEDEDFCWRSALEDYRNYIAGDVFVHHNGSKTLPGDRKILETKWTLSMASPEGKKLAVLRATELANTYYVKGYMDQAVETLVNCIKYAPDEPQIYYELTRFFIESKKFPEARDVVASMPETAKNHLRGLECASYAKEGLGLDDEAAAFADQMLSQHENNSAALNLKGVLAFKEGKKEKAQDFFQKAISTDPGYAEAYANLGVLYWGMENTDATFSHLTKGFMLSPAIPDASSLYYSVVSSLGRFSEAESDFKEACRLNPNHKNLAFLLIDILIQQGKFDVAIIKIEDALALFGLDDGTLKAALAVREKIGPMQIDKPGKKGTLSLCMIVKNEEKHLVRCLKSVRDVVDEMIIVDTGSTDKTVNIAKIFGAKIYEFPWTGDFAAARNESLKYATGDWTLILDADEVIAERDFDELKTSIHKRSPSKAAYSIATRNYTNDIGLLGFAPNDGKHSEEAGAGWVPSAKVRLAPRGKDIFFINPVHELLEPSLKSAKIPIYPSKIIVHHYGKLDIHKDAQKGEDYYLLGKIKYESDPTNLKAIFELAKQSHLLNKYDEATELWLKLLALIEADPQSSGFQEIVRSTHGDPLPEIYIQLASAYLLQDRFDEALQTASKTLEAKVKLKEYINIYALCEIIAGSLDKASYELKETLKTAPDYAPAHLLMAVISCLKGEKEQTQELLGLLRQKQIQITGHLNKLAKQLSTRARKDEALLILNATIENNISNAETIALLEEYQKGQRNTG
jgi:GT2 family glycosyltransferase/Flp pilus assembly protein TadD